VKLAIDILVFLSIAVVVPVVIARLVVRADWRAIRNACLVWYRFLALASGAFMGGDRLGWAMIPAMFLSVLAVAILALAFKLWGRVARG
jgi:hypothetical protein